jgi:structural maintenance of chromosome 1
VAAKSPEGLTTLFEQIAGSDALKAQYEELQAGKEEAEARCALLFAKKKGISQEKRQKKEQKDEAERHMRTQQELVSSRWQGGVLHACGDALGF